MCMLPVATAIQRVIQRGYVARQKLTHAHYAFASYLRREGHLCEVFLVLAKPRLILDEMCRLYEKFASYLRRVLCKTRLIFPRINGPNEAFNLPVTVTQSIPASNEPMMKTMKLNYVF